MRRKPEDGALTAGTVSLLSPAPTAELLRQTKNPDEQGVGNTARNFKLRAYLKPIVRRNLPSFAWLQHVWRNIVRSFYLSLRPRARTTAKGRFPDLSDQLFHRT